MTACPVKPTTCPALPTICAVNITACPFIPTICPVATFCPTVATPTSLYLSIDEDTIGDTERAHTSEQVGYLVFEGPGSAE